MPISAVEYTVQETILCNQDMEDSDDIPNSFVDQCYQITLLYRKVNFSNRTVTSLNYDFHNNLM